MPPSVGDRHPTSASCFERTTTRTSRPLPRRTRSSSTGSATRPISISPRHEDLPGHRQHGGRRLGRGARHARRRPHDTWIARRRRGERHAHAPRRALSPRARTDLRVRPRRGRRGSVSRREGAGQGLRSDRRPAPAGRGSARRNESPPGGRHPGLRDARVQQRAGADRGAGWGVECRDVGRASRCGGPRWCRDDRRAAYRLRRFRRRVRRDRAARVIADAVRRVRDRRRGWRGRHRRHVPLAPRPSAHRPRHRRVSRRRRPPPPNMADFVMRGCAIAIVLATLAACSDARQSSAAQVTRTADEVRASVPASRRTAITEAVARVAPAVVTVQTEVVQRVAADPFESLFGGRSGTQTQAGIGTGFIVRPDGVIVTNAHVIAGANRISVMLRDGTVHPATAVGTDETNDLAVIRIVNASNLPVAPLGDSDNLLVGEWAIAIGNPYGFMLGNSEPSVTAGVISGVGRNLIARGEGPSAYFDMVQTDASINPGNSGGPLVSATGEVIGVNSSIYSTSGGGSIGLGFAIPINRARRVADDLLAHGRVRRPWIGVRLDEPRTNNPRELIARGATVAAVTPGSPAERAGLRRGDVITR